MTFQEHWLAGSKAYFKRDPVLGVDQPWRDIGVVEPINPGFDPEAIELEDSWGGVKAIVARRVNKFNELYEVVTSNLNLDNLALIFLADPPSAFTQAADIKAVSHAVFAGALVLIDDGDTAKTLVYGLAKVAGVASAAVGAGVLTSQVITDINVTTGVITLTSGDSDELLAGDKVIVLATGLADPTNAGTYTVSGTPTTTSVTVVETFPGSAEVGVTGALIYANGTDSGTVYAEDVDWEVVSLQEGVIRCITGGAITTGNAVVHYQKGALSGKRVFSPQQGDVVEGLARVHWGWSNNAKRAVREFRASLTPTSTSVSVDEYSTLTFELAVLSDSDGAGRFLNYVGALPEVS